MLEPSRDLPSVRRAPQVFPESASSYRYSEDQITVRTLFAMLRRRREAFFLTLAISVLVALLWTTALPRTYSSAADVVMITAPKQVLPHDPEESGVPPLVRSEDVETQIQLITSRQMAAQVLEATGLLETGTSPRTLRRRVRRSTTCSPRWASGEARGFRCYHRRSCASNRSLIC